MSHSLYVEAQMWKMYSLADSRYINSDTFTGKHPSLPSSFFAPQSRRTTY